MGLFFKDVQKLLLESNKFPNITNHFLSLRDSVLQEAFLKKEILAVIEKGDLHKYMFDGSYNAKKEYILNFRNFTNTKSIGTLEQSIKIGSNPGLILKSDIGFIGKELGMGIYISTSCRPSEGVDQKLAGIHYTALSDFAKMPILIFGGGDREAEITCFIGDFMAINEISGNNSKDKGGNFKTNVSSLMNLSRQLNYHLPEFRTSCGGQYGDLRNEAYKDRNNKYNDVLNRLFSGHPPDENVAIGEQNRQGFTPDQKEICIQLMRRFYGILPPDKQNKVDVLEKESKLFQEEIKQKYNDNYEKPSNSPNPQSKQPLTKENNDKTH